MKQSGRREPRHQRGILDRVPEPPAAPAELIIGPVAASGDPQREEDPRGQHPRPHRASERRADFAGQERRDRDAERDRQADIAEVERRRVEGQAGVLEQGVQPPALDRRRVEPRERVRGEQQEGVEAEPDGGLGAKCSDQHRFAKSLAEQRDPRSRGGQHADPQQHRALVIAPCAREFVNPRLGAVAVGRDQCDRQVGAQEHGDEQGEGQQGENALRDGDRTNGRASHDTSGVTDAK